VPSQCEHLPLPEPGHRRRAVHRTVDRVEDARPRVCDEPVDLIKCRGSGSRSRRARRGAPALTRVTVAHRRCGPLAKSNSAESVAAMFLIVFGARSFASSTLTRSSTSFGLDRVHRAGSEERSQVHADLRLDVLSSRAPAPMARLMAQLAPCDLVNVEPLLGRIQRAGAVRAAASHAP
jgi:hypothetical protein